MKRTLSLLWMLPCLALLASGCRHGEKRHEDPILKLGAEESIVQGKGLMAQKKYSRARPFFTHTFEVEPNSAIGREALLLSADTYYLEGGSTNFVQAEAKYRDYLNRFPTSEQAAYVQFQIANSLAKRMERPDRDQAVTRKALEAYDDLVRLYPTSEYADQAKEQSQVVRENLAEHEFLVGDFYLRYGAPQAAVDRFEYLLKSYPSYAEKDKVIYYLGVAYGREKKPEDSRKAFEKLRKEFPKSPYVNEHPRPGPEGREPMSASLPALRRALSTAAPLALTLAVALASTGCAGAALGSRPAVDPDDVAELKARVIELQRKAAMDEVEIARLREQVAALAGGHAAAEPGRRGTERRGSEETAAGGGSRLLSPPPPPQPIEESDLDIPRPVPQPTRGTTAPPGQQVPAAPHRAPAAGPAPRAGSPAAPAPPAAEPARPAAPAPSTGAVAAEAGEPGRPVPAAAQALYDRGYSLYNQGRYVDAEASFQRFLQAEPASDLSDNALYWIGECRYSRRDLKGALAAFRETVERYPAANKVPDALLKEGETLEAMHDVEGARAAYREVVRRFPNTAAAALAEERRAKLP